MTGLLAIGTSNYSKGQHCPQGCLVAAMGKYDAIRKKYCLHTVKIGVADSVNRVYSGALIYP